MSDHQHYKGPNFSLTDTKGPNSEGRFSKDPDNLLMDTQHLSSIKSEFTIYFGNIIYMYITCVFTDNKDEMTLFVKNFGDSATEDSLQEYFAGSLEVRMPKKPNGTPKG